MVIEGLDITLQRTSTHHKPPTRFIIAEMELTLQEERSLKMQVEGKLLQLKKEHSMLDCDYKQAKQKLDELQAQKEKLSEEVGPLVTKNTVLSFTPPSNQNNDMKQTG